MRGVGSRTSAAEWPLCPANGSAFGDARDMRIGILGSGLMGAKLGTLLARMGHQVVFSYSRSEAKLRSLARKARGARAGSPREAADSDVVVLAVHWSRLDDVLKQARGLRGKIVISCVLPMNADDTELVIGRTTSGAEQLARKARGARLVAAFQTIPSEVLPGVFRHRSRSRRPSLVYCGDDARAKKVAAGLIRELGFDPVDLGPLRLARYAEPFGLLVAREAYEGRRGPEVAYRFERFHDGT
jgi:8-hydroxy-5-deazaflavin:NADPH oxidoreductase